MDEHKWDENVLFHKIVSFAKLSLQKGGGGPEAPLAGQPSYMYRYCHLVMVVVEGGIFVKLHTLDFYKILSTYFDFG